jgi:FMN phosphatase YigB (HAD superfamily)
MPGAAVVGRPTTVHYVETRTWATRRDGIANLFSVTTLAEQVGAEKPDPTIFEYALD